MPKTRRKPKAPPRRSARRPFRLLLSCAGRRVELTHAFARAARAIRLPLRIYAADKNWLAPTMHVADVANVVPPVMHDEYIPHLLDLVRREKIDMLVPLLDTELLKIAEARDAFAEAGCTAVVSSPRVVRTCRDKIKMFRFLTKAGIDTPQTCTWREALQRKRHRFPYFMKPRGGSASKGNFVIRSRDELEVLGKRVPGAIVQEFLRGVEHTLDVYTGFDGIPRCAVPRRRLEVRGGEVVKSLVVKDPRIADVGLRVAAALGECRGVVTIQLFVCPRGRICVVEVNPRFGGGVPLAIHAGADFPRWLLESAVGRSPRIRPDAYRDGESMLRFDDSVFIPYNASTPAKTPRRRR